MSFDVGDKVVYPHHGAATIEKREKRSSPSGEQREYLILRLAYGDLTLMVPADNTDSVGLRDVINDEEVDVDSTGHFKKLVSFSKVGRNAVVVKAVNAAGKQTVQSETVLVEE